MKNNIKNQKRNYVSGQEGFFQLIIIIIIALLLMRYFHLTISGIMAYFHLTWPEIINWFKQTLYWFSNLFNSVK
jgi:hypothetical protein